MKKVPLKIMLHHGHSIVFETTENEAKELMRNWEDRKLPPILKGSGFIEGSPWEWILETAQIVGMHTIVFVQQQQGVPARLPGRIPPGSSGIQN